MTLATVGAISIRQTEEAAAVVVLFGIGELLEELAARRARSGIESLINRAPRNALLREGSETREIAAADIAVGDLLDVLPGSQVPTDGIILEGSSSFDESFLTGESRPLLRRTGEGVIAGAIALDGRVQIRATNPYSENTFSRVIRLVEESARHKAPTQRIVESFAAKYTPGVMALAFGIMLLPVFGAPGSFKEWFYKGLTILLIGCPCALVISIPAALTSAIARASRMGILVKGGAALETLGKVQQIFFDKTGTLTTGVIHLLEIHPLSAAAGEVEILTWAASIESASTHPIAKAVVKELNRRQLPLRPVSAAASSPGKGVSGLVDGLAIEVLAPHESARKFNSSQEQNRVVEQAEERGLTAVVVHRCGEPVGVMVLGDSIREEAREVISTLTSRFGVKAAMLTGDNASAARHVGNALALETRSQCLPADKTEIVRSASGTAVVAMVGDGINDAPALAAAHVSVAVGSGTDVALETASVVLARGNLTALVDAIHLGHSTRQVIFQNIAFAIGLKALFLGLTFAGMATLWMAIVADTGATMLVTLNSLRILRHRISVPAQHEH